MTIQYSLRKSRLPAAAGKSVAIMRPAATITFDALITRLAERGSTVTEADARAVLTELADEAAAQLAAGNRVHIEGLCILFPQLRGRFEGATDSFDPQRHRLEVGATATRELRDRVRAAARVERVPDRSRAPSPVAFTNFADGAVNTTVTPGHVGRLDGHRLKVSAAAADEGVFFIPAGGGAEIAAGPLQTNHPKTLLFPIPAALTPGLWHIEVRSRRPNTTGLRIGRLDRTLTT